jgi:hypothetical protein
MAKQSLSISDVYLRYTAVYTWLANQTSHAGMGFFFTGLVMLGAYRLGWGGWYWWGLLFPIVPLVKDTGDYLSDACVKGRLFLVYHKELVMDGVADGFFWSAGTLLAVGLAQLYVTQPAEFTQTGYYWLAAGVVMVAGVVAFIMYFWPEKRAFDKSGLPYYYRLPSFSPDHNPNLESAKLCKAEIAAIRNFVERKPEAAGHLVVGGAQGVGKTTLGLAIGSGLTVRIHGSATVRYITWTKLIEALASGKAGKASRDSEPWHLNEARYAIIDDLPPLSRIGSGNRRLVETEIKAGVLQEVSGVWITGKGNAIAGWTDFLTSTVIGGNNIGLPFPVDLSEKCKPGDEPEKREPKLLKPFCVLTKVFQYGFYVLLLAIVVGVAAIYVFTNNPHVQG